MRCAGAKNWATPRWSALSAISLRAGAVALVALLALALAPTVAPARPAPTPAPTATPVADPAVTKIARQQFLAWQIGSIDKSLYSPQVVTKLTDAKVADVSAHVAPLGALLSVVYVGPFIGYDVPTDARGYIYKMVCANGTLYQWMIIDAQGKIATIFFRDTLTTETISEPGTVTPSPSP